MMNSILIILISVLIILLGKVLQEVFINRPTAEPVDIDREELQKKIEQINSAIADISSSITIAAAKVEELVKEQNQLIDIATAMDMIKQYKDNI